MNSASIDQTAFESLYRLGEKLGTGSFSTVYKAQHLLSGEEVAIKVISKENEDFLESSDTTQNEIDILLRIPNFHTVIEFYEKLETEDKIYLIFELFHGEELFSIVKKKKK